MFIPESSQLVLKLLNPLILPPLKLPVPRLVSLLYLKQGVLGNCLPLQTLLLTINLPNLEDGLTCSWKSFNIPSLFSPMHQECHSVKNMLDAPSQQHQRKLQLQLLYN